MLYYILLSYLIGSIPFAYLWTKLCSGFDIRQVASRNVGTTNVMLNVGVLPGVLTMAGDVLKGALVALIGSMAPLGGIRYILPAVAIAGHNWPIWLKFRGGGGLATFIGGSLIMAQFGGAVVAVVIWGTSFLLVKNHDKSALLACFLAPAVMLVSGQPSPSLIFYASSSLIIALRRVQSLVEKKASVTPPAPHNAASV